ncbi:MAG TPA: MBL fold metallo-hydrolase [Rhizomicrobium sp.]|nr:MBL fold metallo-hydrolase [Rhizomicrobium sp.]
MRRVALLGAAAVLSIAAVVFIALQSVAVDTWLFRQFVHRAVSGGDAALSGDNALAVLLVGTGTPLPDVTRAGPSTLIAAGPHLYLVDAGVDSARNLQLWKVPLDKIDGVLITHLHSDHIGGLAEIRLQTWVAGRKAPLKVYGPPGIERVVAGFNEAYAIDDSYRTKHHGAAMLPPQAANLVAVPVVIPAERTTTPVFDRLGLKATAVRVKHEPANPAYGYRFDFEGRSVTVSGDTIYDEDLAHLAQNGDVLVHEALAPELVGIMHDELLAAGRPRAAKIMHDIPGYHSSPVDAARIANLAHVKLLVYTHLLPILPNQIAIRAFLKGVSDVRPDGVKVGYDGLIVRLPRDSAEVDVGDVR